MFCSLLVPQTVREIRKNVETRGNIDRILLPACLGVFLHQSQKIRRTKYPSLQSSYYLSDERRIRYDSLLPIFFHHYLMNVMGLPNESLFAGHERKSLSYLFVLRTYIYHKYPTFRHFPSHILISQLPISLYLLINFIQSLKITRNNQQSNQNICSNAHAVIHPHPDCGEYYAGRSKYSFFIFFIGKSMS